MFRCIFTVFFLLFFFVTSPFAGDQIRLTNGEWAPYLSQHLHAHGMASHIVQEAFALEGIEVLYGFFPWKRGYELAKQGRWHGSVVWVHTKERAKDFLYSDVVVKDSEYLFHLKERPLIWHTLEDLRDKKIGITLHTVYPNLQKAQDDGILILERAGTYPQLFQRLLRDRIDAIPQVSQVGNYLMRTSLTFGERRRITRSPTPVESRHYHLILSKAHPDTPRLLRRFNRGLARLKASGRYDRMWQDLNRGFYDRPPSLMENP